MASSGPSAAFFDLDRTLISGSSAFVFATAARRAGLMGTRQLARDGMSALTFKLRGASDDKSAAVRDRILGAVAGIAPGRPGRPQRRGAAAPARQDPPRGPTAARPPSPRRSGDVHRVGVAGRDRRAAGGDTRHDRRHRHTQRGRRRRLHRRARRAVLLRPGQGRGDRRGRPVGRPRPGPVLRLQRLGERPADARGGRPPGRRQPRRHARTPRPPRTAGRSCTSASARRR